MAIEFVPVLLGSDINAYSMARAFHEAYGVKTIVYGMFPASVCAGSRIIDYRVREHNDRVDKVLENVTEVAREFPDRKILVLGCGDNYLNAISAKDRDGLTLDVAMALSAAKVKTTSLSARSMPDGYATVSIVLEVKNQEELTNVINKLGQIQGVYQVKRASG